MFERGLTTPAGYVLPVQRWQTKATAPRWMSEVWKLRRGKVFLVGGDSPVGYRLPLGSLPYIPPSNYPFINPQDPTVPRVPLADPVELVVWNANRRLPAAPRTILSARPR